jgi:hypothetical protein
MTTPAAAVLSHELTRERGDNSRDLLAVSWETEDQFLQLVTSGEELRPRRFGDLQPRLHVCKTCRVQNKKVTGPGKTCRVQNKKVPGLGKNMPCARNKGSWSREKHAVCKTKRFLVSEQTCRVQNKMVPGLGKNMPCARNKGSWSQKKHAVCNNKKGSDSKNW